MVKKYWRCTVCSDIHFGVEPPEICPTCKQINVYTEITKAEAIKILEAE